MNKIILSIVIPVYNLEKYIERCLDSCLEQDIDKELYEIICVNDGSTDRTHDILDSYAVKYPNIKVLHKENEGVVKTRNRGLSLAEGQYVWFVDGDDWIQKNCLKYLCDIVLSNNCDLLLFKEKRVHEYESNNNINFGEYSPEFFDDGYASFKDRYTTGSGFYWFSKKIIDDYNLFFRPDVYYSDDTLLIAKFKPRVNKMAITTAPIYYYLQRSDSVSHAVNAPLHASCMYKLAKEYRQLSISSFEKNAIAIQKRFKNAQLRAMQSLMRELCISCDDSKFIKILIKRLKKEKLYPFGVDWKQFRRDKKQGLKSDLLNWVFGLVSFEPYFWFCYYLFAIKRKKSPNSSFKIEDFEDNC